ncbi:Na(+)/H(+) antiporter subunit F1 [Ammoniphilus sp. 3BR4]|uniref:Na(+)/H(+) antiporter subunit F1 n=1 Tax=Ammoniphilus sp. 3BR4 TaxID=3158265 RepID=UPI003465C1B9
MFETLISLSLIILSVSILATLYRVFKGPSTPDRVIAADSVGVNIIGLVAIVSVMLGTQAFLEIILLLAILSFIATVSYSKFLERGEVIERNRNR